MKLLKELVLRKIIHMQKVSRMPFPRFRVDSIALALNLPVNTVMECIDELAKEDVIIHYQANRISKFHATSNWGAVSLDVPIYEAESILRQQKMQPIH